MLSHVDLQETQARRDRGPEALRLQDDRAVPVREGARKPARQRARRPASAGGAGSGRRRQGIGSARWRSADNFDPQQMLQKLDRLPAVARLRDPRRRRARGRRPVPAAVLRRRPDDAARTADAAREGRAEHPGREGRREQPRELQAQARRAAGASCKAALEKLPESSDLPALLTNITGLGKKSGLEIQTFKQGKKIDRGFYSEQQIELEFSGAYHDIGLFFDRDRESVAHREPVGPDLRRSTSETGETPILKVKGIAATFYFNDSTHGRRDGRPEDRGGRVT